MKQSTRARRGFALIVTLWVLAGASALSLAVARVAHDTIGAAANRLSSTRAYWAARGCVEQARAAMEAALWNDASTPASVRGAWLALDSATAGDLRTVEPCEIAVMPSGLRLDANTIALADMRRALTVRGYSEGSADSLAAALVDARGRSATGKFAADEQLAAVRGFDDPAITDVVGVAGGRVLWRRASMAVIAGLPGMTAEALDVFAVHRHQLAEFPLLATYPELSPEARGALSRAVPALVAQTAEAPEFWMIRARAADGTPRITVEIEWRVTLGDHVLDVTRRAVRP